MFNQESFLSPNTNLIKFCYQIQVFDSNNKSILPSDLTLHYNLHILCFITINNNTVNIYSLAKIELDKYFKCIEFAIFNESIQFGFIVYQLSNDSNIPKKYFTYFINKSIFNNQKINDMIFNSSKINSDYKFLLSQINRNNNSSIQTKKLKKLYISRPICSLKRNIISEENKWLFLNIFNEYFCFCKGFDCLRIVISGSCKYFFYLYLIDKNKNVYKKNDFLLMDFILKKYTSDDVYPIFEEMINNNLNAHYLTENEEIYKKYCYDKKYCNLVILVNKMTYKINENFLEKYLTLILKLKQVLTSVGININFINNIFYNIDYITYICIGHGVSYFKHYLYRFYYGPKNFDKLLIPNSEKLISMAIKYGWKNEDLIKFNLPRWEKYNSKKIYKNKYSNIASNSILVMFTWRDLKSRRKISSHYIQNILDLINNDKLINNLSKHDLILYFALHHRLVQFKNKFPIINNNAKYIEEKNIAECLSKSKLIITDYSSIIFDMIYRKKPYIIYIPDANDPMIKQNYQKECYNIIKSFKKNDFKFENIYFDLNQTINKINYYIDNKFELDRKLNIFYNEFSFPNETNITNFINSILSLNPSIN